MVVIEQAEASILVFDVSVVASPVDNVVLVFFVETHLRCYEVLDYFLAAAVLEVFRPGYADFFAVFIMVSKRVLADQEAGPHVDVEARQACEQDEYNQSVDACKNDRTLANTDVPNLPDEKGAYLLVT